MLHKRRMWKPALLILSIVLVIVLVGCQNAEFEILEALHSINKSQYYQEAYVYTLRLDLDQSILSKLNQEEQQFYRNFQEVSLTIAKHLRKGEYNHYYEGALEYADVIIPFAYERNEKDSVLFIDGAKMPIYFNADTGFNWTEIEVTEAEIGPAPAGISHEKKMKWKPKFDLVYSGAAMGNFDREGMRIFGDYQTYGWLPGGEFYYPNSEYDQWRSKRIDQIRVQKRKALEDQGLMKEPGYGVWIADLKNTLEKAEYAYDRMYYYLISSTPLPRIATIDDVVMEINGESEQLKRFSVQADGQDMAAMLVGLLERLTQNEDALDAIATGFYDVTTASSVTQLERLRETDPDSEEVLSLQQYLGDRKAMITALKEDFRSAMLESVTDTGESTSSGSPEPSILDQAALAFDMYYTHFTSVSRAAVFEFYLPLSTTDQSPLKGIHLSYAMNRWSTDPSTPVDKIDVSKGKLDYYQKNGGHPFTTPNELLEFFDSKSGMYKLLNTLNIRAVNIDFPVSNLSLKEGEKPSTTGSRAYVENGVTMVPLRFVSEQLHADVQWNGTTKQISIKDHSRKIDILLTLGSKTATVNGKSVTMQVAPVVSPSSKTYVPIRFIAEALGAEVKWDGEARRVGIKRK